MTVDAAARAADVARASYGKLVAIMASRSGDIMAAEDALADAFVKALARWPTDGIPQRPEAWLLTVARNRLTDQVRRDWRLDFSDEVPEMPDTTQTQDEIPDERLKLMFVCAHPAIDPAVHTPLMLQTVLGLEAEQIAQAFLVSPAAMAQRLVRAKRKIKQAGVPFTLPGQEVWPERMASVLEAVYAAYAVDWMCGDGELSHEAWFLSEILTDVVQEPEVLGLASLIGFLHARRHARVRDGVLVPLPEQDTGLWDAGMTERAEAVLKRAAGFGEIGRFQLEAAIQAVHAARRTTGRIDWRALSQLFVGLNSLYPTVGGRVSQAAVTAEDVGPAEGLRMLERIAPEDIVSFQPAWAVRAHLNGALGRWEASAEAYDTAIQLTRDVPTRRWLERKRASVKQRGA